MIRLGRREFEDLVGRCFSDLPSSLQQYLDNLDVVVEDWPDAQTLEAVQTDHPGDLLGLYSGVSRVELGGDLPLIPDKITIFKGSIEAICRSREDVAQEVRKTLLHEVGHYLGMEEEELDRLGYS